MLLTLHLVFIWTTLALVAFADEQGFLWARGMRQTLPAKRLEWLHILVAAGLCGLILTGGLLFLEDPHYYLAQTAFIVKMVFVAALIINSFFVGRFARIAAERPFAALSRRERRLLTVSAAVSILSWAGAALCGLVLH